jgi:hypothetical protein
VSFFQLILEGIIIFLTNSVLGVVLFLALRNYLRDRIEQWLFGALSDYIREQLKITLEHPEETAKLLSPLLNSIIKEIMKDFQQSQKEQTIKIPILGKIPAPIAQALIERFLGGSSKNEGSNPFA